MEIGNQIKQLRQRRGVTQEDLAEHLGVTPQAVSKWETGEASPDILLLPKLAAVLETTTDHLLGCTESSKEKEPLSPCPMPVIKTGSRKKSVLLVTLLVICSVLALFLFITAILCFGEDFSEAESIAEQIAMILFFAVAAVLCLWGATACVSALQRNNSQQLAYIVARCQEKGYTHYSRLSSEEKKQLAKKWRRSIRAWIPCFAVSCALIVSGLILRIIGISPYDSILFLAGYLCYFIVFAILMKRQKSFYKENGIIIGNPKT